MFMQSPKKKLTLRNTQRHKLTLRNTLPQHKRKQFNAQHCHICNLTISLKSLFVAKIKVTLETEATRKQISVFRAMHRGNIIINKGDKEEKLFAQNISPEKLLCYSSQNTRTDFTAAETVAV